MRTAITRCLDGMVTEQRWTFHLPTIHLPMETLACLTLVRPSFSMHQYYIRQFLMNTRFALVALRTAAILLHSRQGAITLGILASDHTVVASTTTAGLTRCWNRHSMGHLQVKVWMIGWTYGSTWTYLSTFKHAAQSTISHSVFGTPALETTVSVDTFG